MKLRAAFVGGPAYDPLYETLAQFTAETGIAIEIGFQAPHMDLNRHLETAAPGAYHLISAHSKYAASQTHLLAPLDAVVSPSALADFFPTALDLTRIRGQLYGIPRNIDVRLLHYRTDFVDSPPATWDALLDTARRLNRPPHLYGFAFPGKESGLFGTFYELVESAGGRLFPDSLVPDIANAAGEWALGLLRAFVAEGLVPPETPAWHFDEVHQAFRSGRVAMLGEWPGYYGLHCDAAVSRVAGTFAVARYPAAPGGFSKAYGGGHTFGLTRAGIITPEAVRLLEFLTAPERQVAESARGSVPVRRSVMDRVRAASSGAARARWETLDAVIRHDVLVPPKLSFYPAIEEVLWTTVQQAMLGRIPIRAALDRMTTEIYAIVSAHRGEGE